MKKLFSILYLFAFTVSANPFLPILSGNVAAAGGGGGPAYNSRIAGIVNETSSAATTVLTTTATTATGDRSVILAAVKDVGTTTPTAADDRGNTYNVDASATDGTYKQWVISAPTGTALQVGDHVTITWGGTPGFGYRTAALYKCTGINTTSTQGNYRDQFCAANSAFVGTGPLNCSASTTAANTLIMCVIMATSAPNLSSSDFTEIENISNGDPNKIWFLQKAYTSAGSKNVNANFSASINAGCAWVAFK